MLYQWSYEDWHVYVCYMGNGLPTHCPGMVKSLATPLELLQVKSTCNSARCIVRTTLLTKYL